MKIIKKYHLVIVLIFLLLLPGFAAAITLNLNYPKIGGFNLNDPAQQNLDHAVAWVYYFVITISGIAVFTMLVWGGFTWLTSTGDPGKIADARDRIYSAFLGLIIILASFLIMRTINPELVFMQLPELPTTCPEVNGTCTPASTCSACHAVLFDCDSAVPQCCCLDLLP